MTAAAAAFRCSDAARERGDALAATAGPARRFVLVEIDGPWGPDALRQNRLDERLDGALVDRVLPRAERAGARLLVIRRPGRHVFEEQRHGVLAIADLGAGAGRRGVAWHRWGDLDELSALAELAAEPVMPQGPQQVALVCTHGRHDLCCAVRGRPVANALAGLPDWDVWECSHVGGDRFAANVVLLPDGDVFGGLDPSSAVGVVRGWADGRISLPHHRGRFGQPAVEQAAEHLARVRLGEELRGAVDVVRVLTNGPEGAEVEVRHEAQRYRIGLAAQWSAPERLTCRAVGDARARTWRETCWAQVPAAG